MSTEILRTKVEVCFHKTNVSVRLFSLPKIAVEFLLNHGFRMDAPFVDGIPYLSRNEELDARLKAAARQDRAGFAILEIPANDIDTHQFMKRVRSEIGVWKDNKDVSDRHGISNFYGAALISIG